MIVACVRTGARYSPEYVYRLKSMVWRWLPIPHEFICLTDLPADLPDVNCIHIGHNLPGYWGKMALFSPIWRGKWPVIYLDLDTVICGDLSPLAALEHDFAILENMTRLAGHPTWPCRYGAAAMVIGPGFGADIWTRFIADRAVIMRNCGRYGDQMAIETLYPGAVYLQDVLPPGFFLGYRELAKHPDAPPPGAAAVVFAGRHKPDNCNIPWIKREWR